MKQVIVTGGRDYDDWAMIQAVLGFIKPDLVVQGGASGADKDAQSWARYNDVKCVTIPAAWDLHGKAAGPKRNVEMIESYPDAIVVAFPGGAGTESCVKEAVKRNRVVLRVER